MTASSCELRNRRLTDVAAAGDGALRPARRDPFPRLTVVSAQAAQANVGPPRRVVCRGAITS
jgi:hypothetical protein